MSEEYAETRKAIESFHIYNAAFYRDLSMLSYEDFEIRRRECDRLGMLVGEAYGRATANFNDMEVCLKLVRQCEWLENIVGYKRSVRHKE